MRYLVASAVVLMLIGAPLGSYFYLRSGLAYRLDSQEQLSPKEVSKAVLESIERVRSDKTATLIHTASDGLQSDVDLLSQIDDRIVDRDHFEIISFSDPSKFGDLRDIRFIQDSSLFKGFQQRFILIDSAGVVRNTYKADRDIAKVLIRHLAVVIPLPKHRDIRLRRELEN